MKNFWPHRPKADGFSIQNLAREYRLKISSKAYSEIFNQPLENKNLRSIKNNTNNLSIANLSLKRTHWANRDFSEYKEAA